MRYKHFVPMARLDTDFPFSYRLRQIKEAKSDTVDITIKSLITNSPEKDLANQKEQIRLEILKVFKFHNYLDINSPNFLSDNNNLSYTINIIRYTAKKEKYKIIETVKDNWLLEAFDFKSNYQFNLIRSIEQLKDILKVKPKKIGFDTETTGLNPEEDNIVGISFSFQNKIGYYVPIKHDNKFKEFNLGIEAMDIIYEALVEADIVFMFNSRFDMRMMEYTDKKYDMLKVNVIDTQLTCHYADPEFRFYDLKTLERHFLGITRQDLKETLKLRKLDTFNFALISPEDALFYAAQDGISTYELGIETYKYFKEFGMAAEIDKLFLPRLMRLENNPIRIDTGYLEYELNEVILPRLAEIESEITKHIGTINLNSPKQKEALFESFGLDTGVKTKTGAMSTGTQAVLDMIDRYNEEGKKYPKWLELLGEQATLEKLSNSFFGKLLPQAKENNNRIRINYRVGVTATGRLSSGAERGL